MAKINGNWHEIEGKTIEEMLHILHYDLRKTAVECNGEIVPKSHYGTVIIQKDDVLEVVSFVSGG